MTRHAAAAVAGLSTIRADSLAGGALEVVNLVLRRAPQRVLIVLPTECCA